MNLDFLIYPFIFAAIYFEAFLLVTFLSKPAREERARSALTTFPKVAMIVPCYNEGTTIDGTVRSLLETDYPKDKLDIILVNDGSTDNTREVMEQYRENPQIKIIHKENGGKHTGLNAGIELAVDAEFVGCLDADSFVDPHALKEVIAGFHSPDIAAVTSAMSVYKPSNLFEHTQNAEYVMGIALRHILAAVNGLHVTPGPLSLYRRSIFAVLGGFAKGHNTEDMEMALRIQRAHLKIANAPLARVYTKVPTTPAILIKQRTRWTTGFLRNVLFDYRDLVLNPRYGALGMLVLPLGFLSLIGALVMLMVSIYNLTKSVIETVQTTNGIPLEYILHPEFTFDWFYLPVSAFILFGLVASIGSLAFIVVGKTISKTPGPISIGIIGYILIFGLLAPFWLVRSFYDVIANNSRSWR